MNSLGGGGGFGIPPRVRSPEGRNMGRVAVSPQMARFARCVSAVIADLMKKNGYENVYQVVAYIPEAANIAPMTAYSAIYGRGRPNLYVLKFVAEVLGVTVGHLCERADLLMGRSAVKTVRDLFGGASPKGRKPAGTQKRVRS